MAKNKNKIVTTIAPDLVVAPTDTTNQTDDVQSTDTEAVVVPPRQIIVDSVVDGKLVKVLWTFTDEPVDETSKVIDYPDHATTDQPIEKKYFTKIWVVE